MDEFNVRIAPHVGNKKYHVFKSHKDDSVSWTGVKMRRDNDYQPWQIKFGSGRTGRRFKAIKEGGVGDNASYFVFYKPNDSSDTYEVCPMDDWYNVSATQRYKTLTAEEAEQKFEQRHKMLNLFSVMHLKKNGENGDEGCSSRHDSKAFKVSEMDDWDQSGDDEASGDDDDDMDDSKKKVRRKKGVKKEKGDADDAPDEAKEESDEGDFEQREVDYMSDSSSESSDPEVDKDDENDVKGIAEEEALRDLLSTDDDDDVQNVQQKGSKSSDNKVTLGTIDIPQDPDGNGSEDSSDSDDYDVDEEKMDSMFMKKGLPAQLSMVKQEFKQEVESNSAAAGNTSGSSGGIGSGNSQNRQQSNSNKRKIFPEISAPPPQPPKRPCTSEAPSSPPNGQEKIVEDLIRKYLSRKPMTLKTLLKDIKSKLKRMEGVTPEMDNDLVNTIASIIKRLQPDKQKINDVTYLSLKS